MSEVIRRRAVVRGLVQGVGYRAACAREAGRLGVAGWVRNRDDGTVEVDVQGAAPDVGRLLEWCRRGPHGSRVDGVDLHPEDPGPPAAGFRVAP